MTSPQFDLLVRANRVFCAETGLDGPGTVAIRGDRIVAAAPEAQGEAREVIDLSLDLLARRIPNNELQRTRSKAGLE